MKRLVWTIAVILTVVGICLSNAQAKLPGEENLVQKIKEVLTPTISVPKNLLEGFHPVCATPAFVWIPGHKKELSPEAQVELSLLMLTRPTFGTTEKTYNTPGGHFKIHYVTSTVDSVYQSHVVDTAGVPLYVTFIGGIADLVWAKEVDTLGYTSPPSDLSFPGNGGDGRYDIYLKSMN
ncbi:MAG TPA: hypothetical protein VMT04_07880, partial [Terriglobales bacterium]|nr:hypothetical protein [Terriglobales bacterium]